ncbi:response regulator [Pseudomonas segetis]|uniref:Response regulator receiver domain-containing protein n=1 Tax=Pseudomonas segetis TaxID=298908 RepID=A0A239FFB0_9PSED|nr:response regulator [Pseudomonas segetis]SNS54852.1 Response regulator receiver domain-containing protein [Pseudomonas segetis]
MQDETGVLGVNLHTILVVEDDAVVRTLTLEVLEAFGYQVFGAEDGDTALSILRSEQALSLLMTDIGLPDISGLELAQQAQTLRPDIAVLLASGYDAQQNQEMQDAVVRGAVATIRKPFQLDQLRSTLQAMLA